MKSKILILIFFLFIILTISFSEQNSKKINYTLLGDKKYFKKDINYKNYSDLLYENLNENNKIKSYSKQFTYDDLRTTELYYKIKENEKQNNKTLQNVLYNSDIILLNVGSNEILYKLKTIDSDNPNIEIYEYLDKIIIDINKLIDEISTITKSKIIFLGFYNETINSYNDYYIKYINSKIRLNKKIIFIDLQELLTTNNQYMSKEEKAYITKKGNYKIYKEIQKNLKDNK